MKLRKEDFFIFCEYPISPAANIARTSTCHSERRKTKREEKKDPIITAEKQRVLLVPLKEEVELRRLET